MAARPPRPVELTFSYLVDMLSFRKVIDEEQAEFARRRSTAIRQQMTRANRDKGHGAVHPTELIAALQLKHVSGKLLSPDHVADAIASDVGLPFMKLDPLKLDPHLVTETLSKPFARHNVIIPIHQDGDELVLALADPYDISLQDSLRRMLSSPASFVISSREDILQIITEFFGFRKSVTAAANDFSEGADLGNLEQFVSLKKVDEIEANDAHIVNAVEYLLHYAFKQRASDIHVEPKRDKTIVRLRIDGILHQVYQMPKVVHAPFTSRIKMLARMDIAEKRRPQGGRIKTESNGREVELRVSSLPVAFGEKIVIRVLDPEHLMMKLPELGMGSEDLKNYQRFLRQKTGLILVTGPTGSGKTSTLYSSLREISGPGTNITTVEDPIEMVFEDFNQVQVQERIDLNFAEALRTILRQDPDVIMVGEIRDEETAEMAVQAALTGHLVISTLHTNDAPSSIARLMDLGVKPFLIASTLLGVVAQRLLRKVCQECAQSVFLSEAQVEMLDLKLPAKQRQRLPIKRGKGCSTCRQTGLLGRTAIFEVLNINDTLRRLIQDQANAEDIRKAARADGMLTLRESAIRKMAQGITSFSEVISVVGVGP